VGSCALGPLCSISGLGNSIANGIFDGFTNWVASASGWVWRGFGAFLTATSRPTVIGAAATPVFNRLVLIAPLIALGALVASALSALRHGDVAAVGRQAFLAVPLCALAIAIAVPAAMLVLSVVDGLCTEVSGNLGLTIARLATAASAMPSAIPGFAAAVLDIGGLVVTLLLWFELVVRNAVLALLLALTPVVFAAALLPSLRRLALRLVETFVAVALSKFVVVVALALGATASTSGSPTVVVTGIAIVLLAAFTPFVLLRVVPLLEVSALLALEGTRERAMRGMRRGHAATSHVASALSPSPEIGPPERPEDLGFDYWPTGEPLSFPEPPETPPVPPVGRSTLRQGKMVILKGREGAQIGWHWDD
jgi:hypothetical protein